MAQTSIVPSHGLGHHSFVGRIAVAPLTLRSAKSVTMSSRRITKVVLFGARALLLVLGAWFARWMIVPSLLPGWVVVHSPVIDPVLRASALGDAGDEHVGVSRLAEFGPDAVPIIIPYLKHPDPKFPAGFWSGPRKHP